MATRQMLGFRLSVSENIPQDVKQVRASVVQGENVLLPEEVFDVPGESTGEFWVEQGTEYVIRTKTIDESGNENDDVIEFPKVAVDLIKPEGLTALGVTAIGEREEDIPDPPVTP